MKAVKNNLKGEIITSRDLRMITGFLIYNWWLLIVLPLVFVAFMFFSTYRQPDVYGATTQILLKSDETYDYQNRLYKGLGYYGVWGDITNQMRVLKSYDLVKQAIRKLDFDVSYFIVGRIKTTELYEAMPFEVDARVLNMGVYQVKIDLFVKSLDSCTISYPKPNGENHVFTIPFNQDVALNDFVITISHTELLHERSLKHISDNHYQFQLHSENYLVNKYKSAISVENIEYTTIIKIDVQDEIPQRAKAFLDTLSRSYINYTLENEYTINANTVSYIDKQLDTVTNILDTIETTLENYKESKAILDLSKESDQFFKELVYYDSQKRTLEMKIQSLNSLENYILNTTDDKLLPPSLYILEKDDYLETSLNELYNLQMQDNTRLYSVTEESKSVSKLRQNINLLKGNILTYIGNSRKAIQDKIVEVNKQIKDYENLIRGVPRSQRDLLAIQRRLQVHEKMYVFLLEKRANTEIARAGIIPQVKLIETARSVGKVGPQKSKPIYFSGLIGLALAVIVGGYRFLFLKKITKGVDITEGTDTPLIGQIPLLEKKEKEYAILVESAPRANITEAFRSVRTNLQYLTPNSQSKKVLVTSFYPGEGKTFCSTNIAALLAKAGKKVMVVDFDLHKPKVNRVFNLENNIGLSTYLSDVTLVEIPVVPSGIENLDVLVSGPVPPNASELVLSDKTRTMLAELEEKYDYVFLDTPPFGLIADAVALMQLVDTSVFVMNTKFARNQTLKIIEEIREKGNLSSTGIILNAVKNKRWRYYYGKYYGYGHGGYGYGGYGYGGASSYYQSTDGK
ncbi:MAG: polysaccharide biosynthesis tyrosine autokinase [Flavobacteriales bacterium]